MAVKSLPTEDSPVALSPEHEGNLLEEALLQQGDGEAHDLGLIVERLGWTPEQRLDANASFLRLYAELRPDGPLIRD